ncbi:MAG: dTDP-4-dehydrorhamnose 3,5-epimerase [Puia sp.]|nr:dTDP-4-dehydrorhamnose 3,5-epimerase [Puia sp.]
MIFIPTGLEGSYTIDLEPFADERGWFARTYCKDEFLQIGHDREWVQLNHSCTREPGMIRGLHFQRPPHQEIKLIRCVAGAVFDVMIDLRRDSPTLLRWFGIELSAANKKMVYIPEGFAHGFQCLSENSELIYHHTRAYTPGSEGGVRYDDPAPGIKWPLPVSGLSERDKQHSLLPDNFKGI